MSKATEMAKVSAKGGFNLFWGQAVSTVISALGIIIVARLLFPSDYGIYTIVVTAPTLIILFRDWGIDRAIIKYTAQYNSENKLAKVKSILMAGSIFEIILGLSLTALSFLLAGFLATSVFQRPAINSLIQIASLIILGDALVTATQSALIGLEKMAFNSLTMVVQSCLRAFLMAVLIILGLGTYGAILGAAVALLLAGLFSILILSNLYKKLQKPDDNTLKIDEYIKTMFKYGLPLSISTIISGFLTQFYIILIAIYTTNSMIGNYSVASNFAVLISFFSMPIATVLFPAFSKLDPQKESETLRNVFQFSVKYAAFLVVPATAAIISLSQPVISTLFGQKYSEAPLFLALIAIAYLFSACGSLSIGNLINGQGETRVNLLLTVVTSAIGFPMSILLIPRFGIIGLIITSLTSGIPSLILGLWWIKKHYGATVDWVSSTKILLASSTAAAITYVIISQLIFRNWIRLIIGLAVFLLALLPIALSIRTVNTSDIDNVREMLSELGPLSHLLNHILDAIEKLIAIFQF